MGKITAEQRRQGYVVELEEAREIMGGLRAAYKDHVAGRGLTKRYKIKDREMEFSSLADLLKQIRFWQQEITRLEAAAGVSLRRSGRIITRF